jgi:hypothetical protein
LHPAGAARRIRQQHAHTLSVWLHVTNA